MCLRGCAGAAAHGLVVITCVKSVHFVLLLQVGYSSDSEDEGERHPADPSEHHTYEVKGGFQAS